MRAKIFANISGEKTLFMILYPENTNIVIPKGNLDVQNKTTTKFLQLQKTDFIDAVTEHNTCKDYEKRTLRYVSGTVNTESVQACIYMGGASEAKFA